MNVQAQGFTAAGLERMPGEDAHVELIRGKIVKLPPAGAEHGETSVHLGGLLDRYARQMSLGRVYAAETGFIIRRNPDTVRAPDAAFVTMERVQQQVRKQGFFDGPPDLAVEVISPDDSSDDVEAKVLEYLEAGTRIVWVVRPRTRTVTVYRSLTQIRVLTAKDALTGEDLLPGFSVPVEELFG